MGSHNLLNSERTNPVIFCYKIAKWAIALVRAMFAYSRTSGDLVSLTADAAGQLHVLGHDGDPLGMKGTQVGVLEQAHEVGLASLL